MFLGWIAISLSLAGAAIGIRAHPRLTIFYLLLGMAAYNLSLGPAVRASQQGWRLYDLLSSLQPIGAFRAPARFAEIVILSMSVLVALTVAAARVRFPRATAAGVIAVIPLMLSEYYLVGFPGGKPQPLDVPAIYSTPELRSARALVSLPDYRGTPAWYNEPDYLLFSTVHWRPIVNGYGRSEPPEHFRVISHMNAFPGPNNARTMRRLGVEYVVLHTARIGPGAEDLVKGALDLPHEYELVTRNGGDYLFRVKR